MYFLNIFRVGQSKKKFIRFGNDKMNSQCKWWSVKLILIFQLCFYNKFTCNAAVWIWSSSSKINGRIKGKERKAVYFMENASKNRFLPKSQKNFLESRVLDMGRSSYMKHKYFFPRPNDTKKKMSASCGDGHSHPLPKINVDVEFCTYMYAELKEKLRQGREHSGKGHY